MFTPTNISSMDEIAKMCKIVQDFCETHYEADNANACVDRGQQLEQYMATISKMYADAKHHKNTVLNGKFLDAVKKANDGYMSASTMNKYIDTLVADYDYLVDWTNRLNSTCTHQLDFTRTVISKLKEEMRLAGWGVGK